MSNITAPIHILDNSPMNYRQILAVVVCILLNALDGFDVLAISFSSPGIASEWAINRAELGVVLAMELIGMAFGSILLGGLADKIGRRPTILLCLVIMTAGMYAASMVVNINQLLLARFLTGLGIGGMLASVSAMVAEYSNAKYRNLAVMLMAAGYPVGAVIGGSISTVLLDTSGWRSVFGFGALCTLAFIPLVWFLLPESIEHLAAKRPKNALERINKTLQRMGHQTLTHLPQIAIKEKVSSFRLLFSDKYRYMTLLLIVGYFMHIMTFYYILKWIPKIVVDMGYQPSLAGSVLVWANVGGIIGSVLLGLMASRFKLRKLMTLVLTATFVMVSAFGLGQNSLFGLSLIAAITGVFTTAGVVGFYALIAAVFPSEVRASGTGMVIGIGRGGAALGPVVGGFLFSIGFDLFVVSMIVGAGALIATLTILLLGPVLKKHHIKTNV